MNKSERSKKTDEPQHAPHYGGVQYGNAPYGGPAYYGGAVYGGEAEDGIDLMRLVQVALRRWKTILLVIIIAAGLGLIYLHFAAPIYQAKVLMEMSIRKPRLVKESAVLEDQSRLDTDMIFNTRLIKFQSVSMRERVAAQYLAAHPNEALSAPELVDFLEDHTDWSVQRKSFIVEVSIDHTSPEFARDVANLYADCATRMMIDENRSSSDNAVAWMQNQADQKKALLAACENTIVEYRTEVSLDALRNQKLVSEETLVQLNQTLVELESKLITERSLQDYLLKVQSNPSAVETVPAGIANAERLQELIGGWWEARMELSALKERYTGVHPQVKDAEAKVLQIRQRLDGYLHTLSITVGNGVELLGNQVRDIQTRIDKESRLVLDLELKMVRAEGHLNSLTREQEAADDSYRSILSRIADSRMAADENTAVLKLLQPAELPEDPIAPRKIRVLALALLLGGMLGYGIAWIIELLEDKLTGVKDLDRMDLDLLALVPHQKVNERVQLATICLRDKFSHMSETFASLRTILTYKEARERYRVILVTSTQPEEGKTITACNLAISMAQAGRKTLLIDLDLRRPRMRKIFNQTSHAISLLHVLHDELFDTFDTLPVNGGHEYLEVITSQPSEKISPAEIIGGKGIPKLIEWAREKYDCVIIDTAPLGVVGDSQCIADYVDGVILAARPERTRKRGLRHTADRIASVDTNVIGVVLNNVPNRRFQNLSDSYHHYNSGYDYTSYRTEPEDDD